MDINKTLENIGLTATEAKIYLAGLDHDSIGVRELVKETSLKRPTIYHVLETLEQKGLVSTKNTGVRLQFIMSEPKSFSSFLKSKSEQIQSQLREIEKIIPALEARKGLAVKNKLDIAHYEGVEGIKTVVDFALYCRSKHWDIIAPEKNFFSEFDSEYARYYISQRINRGITSRSLWEKNPNRRVLTKQEIEQRNPRFLPQIMLGHFKSVLIIFDDKVAIISSVKEKSAILITSKEINDTFSAIFNGLWLASENYLK
ncbi:MAG: helix-turn-helix domain-containing protein [bacterium]|nr:helix-turn-helix domain-containing protein [bacterium]